MSEVDNLRAANEAARDAAEEDEGLLELVNMDADREAGMSERQIHEKYMCHEYRPAPFDSRFLRCECGCIVLAR